MESVWNEARMRSLARQLQALKGLVRLRLVRYLVHEELSVSELADRLRLSQPLVSWHLHQLELQGFVRAERCGREVHYHLERAAFAQLQENLQKLLAEDPSHEIKE